MHAVFDFIICNNLHHHIFCIVYLFILTIGILLEDMEELFHLDPATSCIGCFPDLRSGFLGLRVLAKKTHNSSLDRLKEHGGINSANTQRGIQMGGLNSIGGGSFNGGSSNINYYHNAPEDVSEEDQIIFEPSSLHKYSNDMRKSEFSYITEDDDDVLTTSYSSMF